MPIMAITTSSSTNVKAFRRLNTFSLRYLRALPSARSARGSCNKGIRRKRNGLRNARRSADVIRGGDIPGTRSPRCRRESLVYGQDAGLIDLANRDRFLREKLADRATFLPDCPKAPLSAPLAVTSARIGRVARKRALLLVWAGRTPADGAALGRPVMARAMNVEQAACRGHQQITGKDENSRCAASDRLHKSTHIGRDEVPDLLILSILVSRRSQSNRVSCPACVVRASQCREFREVSPQGGFGRDQLLVGSSSPR